MPVLKVLENDSVRVEWRDGAWSVEWPGLGATAQQIVTRATFEGTQNPPETADWETSLRSVPLSDALGRGRALLATYQREGVTLQVQARLVPRQSAVIFTIAVRNDSPEPLLCSNLDSLHCPQVKLGRYAEPVVYVDSGSQGGTHMAALGEGQTCAGICALNNPASKLGLVCAFVSLA